MSAYRPFSTMPKRQYVALVLVTLVVGQVVTNTVPEHLLWWVGPIVAFLAGIAFSVAIGYRLTKTGVAIAAVGCALIGVILRVIQ